MTRILHVCNEYLPPSQTFINQFVSASLPECEVLTRRICGNPGPSTCIPYKTNLKPSWLKFTYVAPILYRAFSNMKAIAEFIDSRSPDVIHCHFGWSAIDVLELFASNKIMPRKCVVSLHGTDVTLLPSLIPAYKKLLRSTGENVVFSVPSNFLNHFVVTMLKIDSSKVFTLPNTYSEKEFVVRERGKRGSGSALTILMVARFVRWKGHKLLFDALYELKLQGFDVCVRLVGSGRLEGSCVRYVNRLGLADSVRFLGTLSHSDVAKEMKAADLYVQSSLDLSQGMQTETFGVAALEAVLTGMPTVVTEVGGLPETVKGGYGSFVQVCAPSKAAIVDAIKQVTVRPNRLSESEKSYIESLRKEYSNELFYTRLMDLYRT